MNAGDFIRQVIGFDPDNPDFEEILKNLTPPLGAEECSETFKKCGYTYGGISDGWAWNRDVTLTETEIWKLIAVAATYWQNQYQKWYREKQEQNAKLRSDLNQVKLRTVKEFEG